MKINQEKELAKFSQDVKDFEAIRKKIKDELDKCLYSVAILFAGKQI